MCGAAEGAEAVSAGVGLVIVGEILRCREREVVELVKVLVKVLDCAQTGRKYEGRVRDLSDQAADL